MEVTLIHTPEKTAFKNCRRTRDKGCLQGLFVYDFKDHLVKITKSCLKRKGF